MPAAAAVVVIVALVVVAALVGCLMGCLLGASPKAADLGVCVAAGPGRRRGGRGKSHTGIRNDQAL